jgi:putative transposase
MVRRHELSDEQWNVIKSLILGKNSNPGWTGRNNRLFINAVLFVLKTGIPWDDLPGRYGKPTRFGSGTIAGVSEASGSGFSWPSVSQNGQTNCWKYRLILPASKLTRSLPPDAAWQIKQRGR